MHLLSTFRYTLKPRVEIPEVTQMLMNAPSIARDKAPFFWTYLDRPEVGNTMLTWQPLQLMGTQFASDGFIWPPAEQYFTQDMGNGIILEMYYNKAGYAFGEPIATRSRRRFRLCPSSAHNPNAPQIDPSLWIVHYGPIDNNERIPVQMIPRDPRAQHILETRAYLQRCGQIQRKEFILSDRVNWPQIAWPREPARQPMYAANRGVPQAMAYPPHPQAAPPPKRARTAQNAHPAPAPMGSLGPDSAYDDDEDYSRGDLYDHLTPREISLQRYQQNHEWMEEILSSPYRMGQIGFASLGLGLKGELSALTDGIFKAQSVDALTAAAKENDGRLDKEQADAFRKRVSEHIESTNSEIEKMKATYEARMAKFKQNSLLTTAEKDLRSAVDGATPDALTLDNKPEEQEDGAPRWPSKHHKKVDDIVSQVEAQLGLRAEVIYDLRRIQDGGYQEPAPEPVPQAPAEGAAVSQGGSTMGDSEDVDMGGTAAGMLDQMHAGLSSASTPGNNNFPTPHGQLSAIPSGSGTPANLNVPSPQPPPPAAAAAAQPVPPKQDDVNMGGTDVDPSGTAPDQGTGSGDWVVVPKDGGVTPPHAAAPSAAPASVPGAPAVSASSTPNPTADGTTAKSDAPPIEEQAMPAANQPMERPTSKPESTSATGTPAAASSMGFDANDFGSLGDLDTAGDALASFSDTPGDLGTDFMEDSAFGDAFHGVEGDGDDGDGDGAGNTPANDATL